MNKPVFFKMYAEIVNGDCPTCQEFTMLVGLSREHYRCITCGADLEQHINGCISYIPKISDPKKLKDYLEKTTETKDSK